MQGNKKDTSSPLSQLLQRISPQDRHRTRVRMKLAARIQDAMEEKGWRKKDLAEKLGKHPSEITKWLSGTHNFTTDTLADIEFALGISLLKTKPTSIKSIRVSSNSSSRQSIPLSFAPSMPYSSPKSQTKTLSDHESATTTGNRISSHKIGAA